MSAPPPAGTPGELQGMAAVGGVAALTSALAPGLLLRVLGVPREELTPTALLGLRLFAIRTAWLSALAARGNETAAAAFLPVQALDQLAWWELYRRGALRLRPTLMMSAISGAIVAFDIGRRLR